MRLIDADKIRYSDMSDGHVPGGLWYTFKDNVDKIPTVEAIPIEWIEKWACEFCNPNSEGYKMAMELIHDWRNENAENSK